MPSSDLFGGLFVPDEVREATSDRAWVQAMLDFEAALAAAQAGAGVIPPEAAQAIAQAARAERFDPVSLARQGRAAANPAAPLVRALRQAVGGEAAGWVHWGATSQDVMDSAAMLVAQRSLEPIGRELEAVGEACAELAERHRSTPMVARTLLQQALPTTFGYKAAGWLVGVQDARRRLLELALPVQLGGAAGTLASLGSDGPRVLSSIADELGLAEPELPWHSTRRPVAELGAALAVAAGALEKIALDVKLMAQTEVGEVAESSGAGRGGSSTMPHKRNPVGAVRATACAHLVRGAAGVLLATMAQEHERAAGAWQAEWPALTDALAYTGGAACAVRESLAGLEVDVGRMRANLEAGGGVVMAESVAMALAPALGRERAQDLVGAAARRANERGRSLRDELLGDDQVRQALAAEELERALDPAAYLGSAEEFVDRALAREGRVS